MITASELGRLEGKQIVQISFNGEILEITVGDVFDEFGNEVDRTLRVVSQTNESLVLNVW